jgi:superkiller protein 3
LALLTAPTAFAGEAEEDDEAADSEFLQASRQIEKHLQLLVIYQPGDPRAAADYARFAHMSGKMGAAEQWYGLAIAWDNLGLVWEARSGYAELLQQLAEADRIDAELAAQQQDTERAQQKQAAATSKRERAVELLQQAIATAPGNVRLHRQLADLRVAQGRPDDAVAALRQALDLDPDYVEGMLALARLYVAGEETDQAVALWQKILQQDPANAKALYNLALHRFRQGNMDEALRLALRSAGRAIDSAEPAYLVGLILLERESYDAALEWFSSAAVINRYWVPPHRRLAELHERFGRDQQRVSELVWLAGLGAATPAELNYLEENLPKDNRQAVKTIVLHRRAAQARDGVEQWFELADYFREQGKPEFEWQVYGLILRREPGHAKVSQRAAREYLSRGRAEQAEVVLRKALQKHPDNVELLTMAAETRIRLAQAEAEAGKKQELAQKAEELLERARVLAPDDPGVMAETANTLMWHGRLQLELARRADGEQAEAFRAAATEKYTTAIDVLEQLGPDAEPDLKLMLGSAYIQTDQPQKAIPVLSLVLQRTGANAGASLLLGQAFWETDQPQKAIEVWKVASLKHPNDERFWEKLGFSLVQHGRPEEAITHLTRYIDRQPKSERAWRYLAQAYEAVDRPRNALKAWKEALRLGADPDVNDRIEELMQQLADDAVEDEEAEEEE